MGDYNSTCSPPTLGQSGCWIVLPCNVIVYEEGDGSVVTAVDPLEMFGLLKKDPMAHELSWKTGPGCSV
jgi:hypothetical protein